MLTTHVQHAAFIDLHRVWSIWSPHRSKTQQTSAPPSPPTPGQRCNAFLRPYEMCWTSEQPRSRVKAFNDMARALAESAGDLNLSGVWRKDKHASDSMDDACDAVQLPWVLRQALNVLTTLEIEDTDDHFKTVIKAGGIMDVVECYPWTGEVLTHGRRDKRKGVHTGRVVRTEEGSPSIQVSWENPFGGECSDTFVLSEDGGAMTQYTDMLIRDSGRRCVYKTVYKRQR